MRSRRVTRSTRLATRSERSPQMASKEWIRVAGKYVYEVTYTVSSVPTVFTKTIVCSGPCPISELLPETNIETVQLIEPDCSMIIEAEGGGE